MGKSTPPPLSNTMHGGVLLTEETTFVQFISLILRYFLYKSFLLQLHYFFKQKILKLFSQMDEIKYFWWKSEHWFDLVPKNTKFNFFMRLNSI